MDLRTAVIKLARENPKLRADLVPLLRRMAKSVEDELKGKKFRNPETGNQVLFESLPSEVQKKIREHYSEAGARGTEDKAPSAEAIHEELPEYKLDIVGDDVERAKYVAKKMKEGIEKSADICKLSPPICKGNLGVSRDNMPQIMDKPVKKLLESKDETERKKGQAAVDAGADPNDDRPVIKQLLDGLSEKGVKITHEKVPVGDLKATQREIKAAKTFGMADSYFKGKFDPAEGDEIVVSSDGHILDGHHRWASLLVADPNREMKVIRVDMPMKEFLRKSLEQPGVFRADLQDNIIPKDRPLDLGEAEKSKKEAWRRWLV